MDEAKFLKKHIRTGGVDVHPTEKALIVTYHLEATILGEAGDPMLGEKKECQKIIRLKDLNEKTDVVALAKEIVDKCNLIPPSKVPEVEQLLYYLKKRKDSEITATSRKTANVANESSSRGSSAGNRDSPSSSSFGEDGFDIGIDSAEKANIQNLDHYIELLYEEIPDKTRGAALILQLARSSSNLEELLQNETLLGALARVLREDWKKSLELATHLTYIFFYFSTYTQFHSMISHFKIGALCMQISEYELKRHELWKEDLKQKKADRLPQDYEKSVKKFQILVKKQDQLLRVSFSLLYHLAEDSSTQRKMVNRGVVDMVCLALDRRDCGADLLIVALNFLRKLSAYAENKNAMAKQKVVERLAKLLSNKSEDVVTLSVRLLFNLSFDTELRKKVSLAGVLPNLVSMLEKPNLRQHASLLLYHISIDDESKALFTYTDCIPTCMKLLVNTQPTFPEDLMALLINLSLNKRNAQLVGGDDAGGLKFLMQMAFDHRNVLALKVVRNIASHDGRTRSAVVEYVGDLAQVVRDYDKDRSDFALEALKVLGELAVANLDFAGVLKEYELISWLSSKVQPGINDDDLVLHAVILLGNAALDLSGAALILDSGIVGKLVSLLNAKQDDDEIVLQIVYTFYNMMFHENIRQRILKETQVPAYLIELMHDKNSEIRKMCDGTLDVIAEHGEEWAKKIQEERFRWHNAQWLEMVGSVSHQKQGVDGLTYAEATGEWPDEEDDYLQRSADFFEQSDILNDYYGGPFDDTINGYRDTDGDGPNALINLTDRFAGRPSNGDQMDGFTGQRSLQTQTGHNSIVARPGSSRPRRIR